MAEQEITLRAVSGATARGRADLDRYGEGARMARAVGFASAGVLGGAACIFFPILHFITTWALPLIGILAARRAWRTHAVIHRVEGPCPACAAALDLHVGGVGAAAAERPCPKCGQTVEVVWKEEKPKAES